MKIQILNGLFIGNVIQMISTQEDSKDNQIKLVRASRYKRNAKINLKKLDGLFYNLNLAVENEGNYTLLLKKKTNLISKSELDKDIVNSTLLQNYKNHNSVDVFYGFSFNKTFTDDIVDSKLLNSIWNKAMLNDYIKENQWANIVSSKNLEKPQGMFLFDDMKFAFKETIVNVTSLSRRILKNVDSMLKREKERVQNEKILDEIINRPLIFDINSKKNTYNQTGLLKDRKEPFALYEILDHKLNKIQNSFCVNKQYIEEKVIEKAIYINAIADCSYIKKLGGPENAYKQIINDINIVNGIYRRNFNLELSILNIFIPSNECNQNDMDWYSEKNKENESNYEDYKSEKFDLFFKWIRSINPKSQGLWHLFSDCKSRSAGVAMRYSFCHKHEENLKEVIDNFPEEFILNTGISRTCSIDLDNSDILVHEISHTLGFGHDDIPPIEFISKNELKYNPIYVMYPSLNFVKPDFSPCSKAFIKNRISLFKQRECLYNFIEEKSVEEKKHYEGKSNTICSSTGNNNQKYEAIFKELKLNK